MKLLLLVMSSLMTLQVQATVIDEFKCTTAIYDAETNLESFHIANLSVPRENQLIILGDRGPNDPVLVYPNTVGSASGDAKIKVPGLYEYSVGFNLNYEHSKVEKNGNIIARQTACLSQRESFCDLSDSYGICFGLGNKCSQPINHEWPIVDIDPITKIPIFDDRFLGTISGKVSNGAAVSVADYSISCEFLGTKGRE